MTSPHYLTSDVTPQVLEDTGYGADKFTMVRNSDDTGSLKIVQPLDYENMNDRNGFSFTIQVWSGGA